MFYTGIIWNASWNRTFQKPKLITLIQGFPWGKESTCNAGDMVRSLLGKIPWRRKQQCPPLFLPGNSMDRGGCLAAVNGVAKQSDTT